VKLCTRGRCVERCGCGGSVHRLTRGVVHIAERERDGIEVGRLAAVASIIKLRILVVVFPTRLNHVATVTHVVRIPAVVIAPSKRACAGARRCVNTSEVSLGDGRGVHVRVERIDEVDGLKLLGHVRGRCGLAR
jgi:hypothetical protein